MSSLTSAKPGATADLLAGITAAAVVLPKAMAYATVAGLPVAIGLYTAFVPMVLYALLGSSRVLSVSSTSTLAILTATQLGIVVPDGDPDRLLTVTATLTMLVGILLMLAAVLRLGFVANFISLPVLVGFKGGIGLVIILDQLPKLFGVHIHKENFFADVYHLLQALPQTSWLTLAIALVTLVLLVFMEWRFPHSPAPLLGVAIGIALVWGLGLNEQGVSIVGTIPTGLPALQLPDLALVLQLLPGAAGIALMSFTETIAAGRAFVGEGEPELNPNRELVATGLANLGGAFCGSMPAGGGTSQTAVVRSVGGVSQRASVVTATMALATMLFLAPLLSWLPHATLAVVVIVYSVGLIQPGEFRKIGQIRMMEFRWAVIACLGVLIFGTLQGIVVAILASLLGLASQTAQPRVYVIGRKPEEDVLRPLSERHPDDETFAGLLILRPEGRLFFINVQHVAARIRQLIAQYQPRVVVLDMSRVTDVEYSALMMLVEGELHARLKGGELWLAGLNPEVLENVRRCGLARQLGDTRLLFNARAVIRQYQQQWSGEQWER
ncbi:SulP family inorganic anion transporter [Aeromonas allosaccharophila]|uniref:SulP family inorganic anion transporter n=1 Tax=Aeromonas allosaccharophila TaxID=656 RepID=UPI001F3676F4|nr:SulP family inorganic anion transporter [Aeromonas allosaccharophila]